MTKRLLCLAVFLLGWPASAGAQQGAGGPDLARPVSYFVSTGSVESGFQPADRNLARWALEAWATQAEPAVELVPAPEATAMIRIHWVAADEGLFGETRSGLVGGRFVADVYVHPNPDDLGTDIARAARKDPLFRDTIVFLTCVHELGHAFGLEHTRAFADIMYSFQYGGDFVAYFMRFRSKLETSADIPSMSPFSSADRDTFRSIVGASRRR